MQTLDQKGSLPKERLFEAPPLTLVLFFRIILERELSERVEVHRLEELVEGV